MRVSIRTTVATLVLGPAVLGPLAFASGCTHPIHLGGEYTAREDGRAYSAERREKIAETTRWLFLWGFVDTEEPDLQPKIDRALGGTQVLTDVAVDESTTILGFVVGFFTGGIATEHEVTVLGKRAVAPSKGLKPE